ncbi:MAG: 23S rRNA (uracil(1939)-C(5))-methyltransferase RlmD [Ruminococcaceae bacterium]|nr:23S rRNA (uracil(1939)-C(5))-methyltransferase RlmD [Oscillospiraceae bacterium]
MRKNDTIELEITDITHEGSGVGRYEGMAVFVPLTAVGDVIKAHVLKVNKHYAFAKCNEIISPSKNRTAIDCGAFSRCGGCTLRHIQYEHEAELKQNRVTQTMQRIGKVDFCSRPIICADSPNRYRNKALYPISQDREIGFYSRHSHRVIPCGDCLLHPEVFCIAGNIFTNFIKRHNISVYNEETHTGLLRHFYLRQGKNTNELMVGVVVNGKELPHSAELIDELKNQIGDNLKSVILNINTKKTNVVLGDENILLYGREYIFDILCGVKVRISPHSFYQVNHDMAERLYEKAQEYASPDQKNIIDLYCGAGTIGLSMAKFAKSVTGVEIVEAAVRDANINAKENGINNARFLCGDATKAAEQLKHEGTTADVVILDPPRKGCDEQLLSTVAKDFSPERIVYVSCDVATLARDTAILQNMGYKLREYTPFDLFPRTAHVETVALFERGA